jgi:hypothetical protein
MSGKATEPERKSYGPAFKLMILFGFIWIAWVTVTLGSSFGLRNPSTTSSPTIFPTLAPHKKPTHAPTTSPTKNPTTKTPTSNPTTAKPTTASPTP